MGQSGSRLRGSVAYLMAAGDPIFPPFFLFSPSDVLKPKD